MSTFDRGDGSVGPARAAVALVANGRDSTTRHPVDGVVEEVSLELGVSVPHVLDV
eukprot:CAMPEP_0170464670 /NCGR_PEP_ID=MMETSP0123-20130129/9307_1 /TAXON_ID=182087 /ORGANISM="Favella ehrenbergii, Strain Fehren 1" /LENGTH=54 /DNA_ID=CAMNT_0010730385 /DNA_START=542 /DNA_END=706 /DNA_ORIENTATION=-